MGGKCAEMGCFEGTASWLRHDCTTEEGLSDPVLPQKRPFEGIFAPPGRSHRRLLARCFVHLRRVSCTTLGVTRTDKVVTQWHMAQTSLIHSSPLSTASRTTPARSPHVNERIVFAVSPLLRPTFPSLYLARLLLRPHSHSWKSRAELPLSLLGSSFPAHFGRRVCVRPGRALQRSWPGASALVGLRGNGQSHFNT